MPEAPPPDDFNASTHPYGRHAGDNAYGFLLCSACYKPPTEPSPLYCNARGTPILPGGYFLFRTERAAKEYFLSGTCQACQDATLRSAIPSNPRRLRAFAMRVS